MHVNQVTARCLVALRAADVHYRVLGDTDISPQTFTRISFSLPVLSCLGLVLSLAVLATRVCRTMNDLSPPMSVFHIPY